MASGYFKIAASNWSSNAGWSSSSGGASNGDHPIAGVETVFDALSGNCTIDVGSACASLTMIGTLGGDYAGTLSGSADLEESGGFLLGGTIAWTGTLTSAHAIQIDVTFNGKTLAAWTINGAGGVTQTDTSRVANALTLTAGTLNTATFAVQCGSFVSSNTNARTLTLTGSTLTLTGTGTVFDVSTATNLTLTSTSSTIVISDTSSTGKTFAGGGKTYNALTITGSSGAVTFTGNNTFAGTFTSGATPLVFTGTTQTFSGTVTLTGCLSITGGTMSKASGTVTMNAAGTITNSTASGGATFDANGATDGGGNSGWTNFASVSGVMPGAMLLV